MEAVTDIIRQVALWINLSIWTVVGFLCWIPMLARTTASLSAAILVSTITKADPRHLRANFENAVSFYSRGFDTIRKILGSNAAASWNEDASVAAPVIKWDRVIIEMLWTLAFWGTLAISFYSLVYWIGQ